MHDNTLFVLELYRDGEFDKVRLFRALADGRREAATYIHEAISDDTFVASVSNTVVADAVPEEGTISEDDTREFVESMQVLYKQEAYEMFLRCWDEFVNDHTFDHPLPANFDLGERLVE